jgi:hypothetical protein
MKYNQPVKQRPKNLKREEKVTEGLKINQADQKTIPPPPFTINDAFYRSPYSDFQVSTNGTSLVFSWSA